MSCHSPHTRSWVQTVVVCAGTFLFLVVNPSAFAQTERVVKAAFIEKLTRFIEWPATSDVHSRTTPFVIGVVGTTPLSDHLEQLAELTPIKNKAVSIRYLSAYEKPVEVDLCFIARSESVNLPKIMASMKGLPVLTIGDTLDFGRSGVMVNFFVEQDTLRFEINLEAAREAGFEISGRILKLARIVGGR